MPSPAKDEPKEAPAAKSSFALFRLMFGIFVMLFVNFVTIDLWMTSKAEYEVQLLEARDEIRQEYQQRLQTLESRGAVACEDERECDTVDCDGNEANRLWQCRKTCGTCQTAESLFLTGLQQKAPSRVVQWQKQMEAEWNREMAETKQTLRDEYERSLEQEKAQLRAHFQKQLEEQRGSCTS